MRVRVWDSVHFPPKPAARKFLSRNQTQSICLPQSLAQSVPPCAIGCVQNFIRNNYNDTSCFTTGDLTFLCTSRNLSGLTIGEGAFQCVVSSCYEPDLSAKSGFNVCNDIAGALPRTAGTLTATISAISNSASYEITSISVTLSATTLYSIASPTTSNQPSGVTLSTMITTDPVPPPPTSDSTTPTITFSGVLTASTSLANTRTMSNTHSSSSSSLGATGTAIAAGQVLTSGLSTGAIAGIIAASILFSSLVFAFLIYCFCMRKKRLRHHNRQRFSMVFPYGSAGSTEQTTITTPISIGTASVRRLQKPYRPSAAGSRTRTSLWQRRFPAFENTGSSAATNNYGNPESIRHEHFLPVLRPPSRQAEWPTLRVVNPDPDSLPQQYEWPPSNRLSFDEDLEAVDQDLPALRSPRRTRSSSRSVSSGGAERPAPLRISMIKDRVASSTRIPLTPTYDNGNFYNEHSIGHREANQQLLPPRVSSLQRPNVYQREQPSNIALPQIPQPVTKPAQRLYSDQVPNYGIRSALQNFRKQSITTDRSLSIYTEIEEDETPDEKDRKLEMKPEPSPENPTTPVRDLRWPSIPRSASIAKQAEHIPRPRGARPLRTIRHLAPPKYHRDELIAQRKSFIRTNTSSSANTTEVCAAFPMPPNFSKVGRGIQIANQNPTIVTTATSRPYTTRLDQTAPGLVAQKEQQPPESLAPLAKRYQDQGFKPMSSPVPPRSPRQMAQELSNARFTPNRSNTGDLYLTVDL